MARTQILAHSWGAKNKDIGAGSQTELARGSVSSVVQIHKQ